MAFVTFCIALPGVSANGAGIWKKPEREKPLGALSDISDSANRVTAVDADGGAADKIVRSGRQINGGSSAFVGITQASGRRPRNNSFIQGRCFHGRHHVCINPSRGDCVHLDIERRQLDRHRFG